MSRTYADFLPLPLDGCPVPTTTWFDWRGRRVHVARAPRPGAPRVLGIHGAGGHVGALWPYAALAARDDVEVVFPDLPLYGRTVEPRPGAVRYDDWIDLLCDLVREEKRTDPRPLVLLGASMGGMLAYEVAARTGLVDHVVATCLLDTADPDARAAAARFGPMGRYAPWLLAGCAGRSPLGHLRVPVGWVADLGRMSREPELSRLCATDPLGGATRVPLGLLASWFRHVAPAPEAYSACPVTLAHPAADTWTPIELGVRFLDRVTGAPTRLVPLEGCGHFPVEQPGLDVLVATVREVVDALR
ncbi:alpha/beta hydrolase [Nocardioides zeae]|uniref:Alpha/beta hydrolase n=1 Tax=Nocardioides imazamoxiresistens TaxID=3231893 RepID=A0ABU3PYD1_9ACTN|nr:alpha/beta hydrolase [Nocardioides zeae]MDT9594262.1 alpha/beta hydrolase [Nocardioides zeae]